MKILSPFIPLRAETENYCHTVHVVGRDYTFNTNGLLSSIKTQGVELLAEPMRLVGIEDGVESVFEVNSYENENESFIMSRSDEQIVICGTNQSERFIVDTAITVDYDGCIDIDLKLMTRGLTVAQVFGLEKREPLKFKLDRLWVEIPLKAEVAKLYNMFPNSDITLADGNVIQKAAMTTSGLVPSQSYSVPFKAFVWLGDEERGFGYFAESDENWQPESENKTLEFVRDKDKLVLRIHLLDSHPAKWKSVYERGSTTYLPLTFRFGLQTTPVKPFPKQPYIHNAFHLDCGIKIKGNYIDFLNDENRFDKLKEKGVTTLILHEKWNKCQNWFDLPEFTAHQLQYIVDECHKRGIKVLPYFGYEISALAPIWSDTHEKFTNHGLSRNENGGWWRVPYQRDYVVCYSSDYQDLFINGIEKLMDKFHIDGVYLDGTAYIRQCTNTSHGCGWTDEEGKIHPTYNIRKTRQLFKRLYEVVQTRGGEINVHTAGLLNFTAIPYIHQNWYGENLQFVLNKGSNEDVNLDYFRAEYIGRNIGAPVEFIAYENRPLWCFEQALSMSILHGILPRPNDIEHPLELMSGVWKIFDSFPIENSEWCPYWKNNASTDNEKVKVSYYKYTDITGDVQLLAFVSNISATPIDSVTISLGENVSKVIDAEKQENIGFSFSLDKYGYRILFVK